jgi:hypothetical protein
MSVIFDLAHQGADVMRQLKKNPTDPFLKGQLNQIAEQIDRSWGPEDIEKVLPPPYVRGHNEELVGYAKLTLRNTNGHVSIAKDWPHRLINYYHQHHSKET